MKQASLLAHTLKEIGAFSSEHHGRVGDNHDVEGDPEGHRKVNSNPHKPLVGSQADEGRFC
jgi:hypothetical protein